MMNAAADEETSLHEKFKKKEDNDEKDDNRAHKNALNVAFKESIMTNKWFYLTLVICFYMFKLRDAASTSSSSSSSSSYVGLAFSFFSSLYLATLRIVCLII